MEFYRYTLQNGIRLVHYRIDGMLAHCGLVINTGSKNEAPAEHGMVHLIEHMLFKGTKRRKTYHVLSCLDDVGGELNAYTTKEETAIHASVLKEDYERAAEIISDITFNSIFPPKEIEKEKDVIIEEINSYLDNPGELIFDEFEDIIFRGHPLGRNILGTPESIQSLDRDRIINFVNRNYFTDQMVFCSVGNISAEKVTRLFKKYYEHLPAKQGHVDADVKILTTPVVTDKKMDTFQNHCIIGNIAYSFQDEKRAGLFLLNNILGGQGLNSRLNLALREKRGLAYNVESNYTPYTNTGVVSIYFGTDAQNLEKSIEITEKELRRLMNEKLGTLQLSRAKNQIKGYLARGFESHENLMLSLGKSILTFDRIDSLEELYEKIDELTASTLIEIANEIFEPSSMSRLIYR